MSKYGRCRSCFPVHPPVTCVPLLSIPNSGKSRDWPKAPIPLFFWGGDSVSTCLVQPSPLPSLSPHLHSWLCPGSKRSVPSIHSNPLLPHALDTPPPRLVASPPQSASLVLPRPLTLHSAAPHIYTYSPLPYPCTYSPLPSLPPQAQPSPLPLPPHTQPSLPCPSPLASPAQSAPLVLPLVGVVCPLGQGQQK